MLIKVTLLRKEKDMQAIKDDFVTMKHTGLQIFSWFSCNEKLEGRRKAVQETVLSDGPPPCCYTVRCGMQIPSLSGLPLAFQKHLHSAKIHFLKFSP